MRSIPGHSKKRSRTVSLRQRPGARWTRFIFIGILAMSVSCSRRASQPNILIILADDLGYGDVQCYNPESGKIPTPNIDRLAREGMRFTDAHSSSAVCSPSRYTLLTGRYHWRSRLQKGIVYLWEKPLITPDRLTIADLARNQGYHTAAIGKWHLGWNWPIDSAEFSHFTEFGEFEGRTSEGVVKKTMASDADRAAWRNTFSKSIPGGPTSAGFDYYFGTDVPNWPPFCYIENDKTVGIPQEVLDTGQITVNQASFQGPAINDWKLENILPELGARAVKYIEDRSNSGKPFLLYLSLTSPHTPIAVSANWRDKSGLHNDYADFVMQTDFVIGQVLEALRRSGEEGNTLVIFTSDNGFAPYAGREKLEAQGHFPSGPFRGYKGDVWEGGHRIPFIIRMPGKVIPGTTCDQLVHQADVMATLAEIFGVDLPDNAGEDSYSLISLMKGGTRPVRDNAISCQHDGLQSIRKGSWKLVCSNPPQLYNLDDDPAETRDVATGNPAMVSELLTLRAKLISDGRSTPGTKQENDVEVILSAGN
ncbi:MAG TPA: arylsulfatase [Cyclobacteriaceae bacterium]|nr:arylsulfatase [Cyclobacteriaceae bacterium]